MKQLAYSASCEKSLVEFYLETMLKVKKDIKIYSYNSLKICFLFYFFNIAWKLNELDHDLNGIEACY